MLKSPYLFAISVLITLLSWTGTARADESMALSFALPAAQKAGQAQDNSQVVEAVVEQKTTETAESVETVDTAKQLVLSKSEDLIRYPDALPPLTETPAESQLASPNEDSIGLSFADSGVQMPADESEQAISQQREVEAPEASTAIEIIASEISPASGSSAAIAQPAETAYNTLGLDDWIFNGGSSSLVARTVGSAEGTRMSDGGNTPAYYGHTDPGNGVWNLGTFSYQHGARSPEEADEKQLTRLRYQGLQLEEKAAGLGVKLSLEAKLNGIDLANQAPLAALDRGGYIERLAEANRLGMQGEKAILWARTHAYIDPDTQTWDAPGLGNNVSSISQDQERRAIAIARALQAYQSNDTAGVDSLVTGISADSPADGDSRAGGPVVTANLSADQDLPSQVLSAQVDAYMALSFGLPPVDAPADAPSDTEVLASIAPLAPAATAAPSPSRPLKLAFSPADAAISEEPSSSEAHVAAPALFGMEPAEEDITDLAADAEGADVETAFEMPEQVDSQIDSSAADTEAIADTDLSLPTALTPAPEKTYQSAPGRLLWSYEDKVVQPK